MPKIGDYMIINPGFGDWPTVLVTVVSMEETEERREKYGVEREEVPWATVKENRVCFEFSNGEWGYSDQVDIEASKQAQQYMTAPIEEVVCIVGTLHPLIVEARLNPTGV